MPLVMRNVGAAALQTSVDDDMSVTQRSGGSTYTRVSNFGRFLDSKSDG